MADITANADAWSSTEASNSPSGATTIGTGLDDNLRATQAGVVLFVERSPHTHNFALTAAVASNALTIALKGKDANDPSSINKARIPFRNVTPATGDYSQVVVSAATSLVISSGSTMGATSATAFRLWIVAFNDAGTLRLGAINCLTTSANAGSGRNVDAIYPLSAWGIASSTAEGGAGAADSAQVFYTGTAVTSKVYTVLGYMTWETGLTTAGTWDAVPTRIQLFGAGVPLPGAAVQGKLSVSGAVATGTTVIPLDDTIPQSAEGDQYMSLEVTPTSAANVLHWSSRAVAASSAGAGNALTAALFQDATANALAAVITSFGTTAVEKILVLEHSMLANTTVATTGKIRIGSNSAGTTTFNGRSGARDYGGVMASRLAVQEVMA